MALSSERPPPPSQTSFSSEMFCEVLFNHKLVNVRRLNARGGFDTSRWITLCLRLSCKTAPPFFNTFAVFDAPERQNLLVHVKLPAVTEL